VDAPVKAAAKRLGGVPEEQILLAWAKAKGAVVLTYVSSPGRCREAIDHALGFVFHRTSSKKARLEGYINAGDLGE